MEKSNIVTELRLKYSDEEILNALAIVNVAYPLSKTICENLEITLVNRTVGAVLGESTVKIRGSKISFKALRPILLRFNAVQFNALAKEFVDMTWKHPTQLRTLHFILNRKFGLGEVQRGMLIKLIFAGGGYTFDRQSPEYQGGAVVRVKKGTRYTRGMCVQEAHAVFYDLQQKLYEIIRRENREASPLKGLI